MHYALHYNTRTRSPQVDDGSQAVRYSLLVVLLVQSTTHSHSALTPTHTNTIDEHKPKPWSTSTSTYVVQTDRVSMPPEFAILDRWYSSIIATHAPDSRRRILHTYDTVMHGFAVHLTADEARRLSRVPGVSGVYKDRVYRTHTTRSPGFLGLDPSYGAWPDSDFGDGIIVGIVDSGIWPERASFNDTGLGPVRSTWKGKCEHAEGFNGSSLCNNKLVGARAFTADIDDGALTPRDLSGHGTHVSSTAAGSEVQGANLLNFSAGNAFGMAPKARIAMYKACNISICEDSAIVAAIDAAVSDGVDILSLSLGNSDNVPFPDDAMAVALFGAERHGVFVVLSGGNDGPAASSVTNVAPWMTTVGATTQDRVFPAKLRLGNGVVLTGQSLFDLKSGGRTVFRLVNSTCWPKDLTPDAVMGALVVCLGGGVGGRSAQKAGAAGIVFADSDSRLWEGLVAAMFQMPGLVLGRDGRDVLSTYISSATYPVATILLECETVTGRYSAPLVAAFSSRGPNALAPALLKPDIVAPGVNILAAWSGEDEYAIISGTSMACPHVAGVAALIMKQHSDWTPAMVRSALMTTAKHVSNMGTSIVDNGSFDDGAAATPLAAGAGLVLPQGAIHPGLVYDAGTHDYVDFLCTLNYTAEQMRRFVPELTNCTSRTLPGGVGNLNYPSFVVVFDSHTRVRTLTRTVTKVSDQATETYNVTVVAPVGVKMTVTPATLVFKKKKEQRSYTVEFLNQVAKPAGAWEFGNVAWKSVDHKVVTPVAFTWE